MPNEININILKDSFNTLEECYNDYLSQTDEKIQTYIKDSCIRRFEYTYRCAQKIMNKYLKKVYGKSEDELTMNNIFRFMQGYGFIPNWENWKMYYEKRNNTAHEYNLIKSRELIEIIPQFLQDTDYLLTKLKEKIK